MFYPPLHFTFRKQITDLTRVAAADVHVLVADLGEDGPEHLVGGVTLGADHEVDPPEHLGLGPADVWRRVPAPASGHRRHPSELLVRRW